MDIALIPFLIIFYKNNSENQNNYAQKSFFSHVELNSKPIPYRKAFRID